MSFHYEKWVYYVLIVEIICQTLAAWWARVKGCEKHWELKGTREGDETTTAKPICEKANAVCEKGRSGDVRKTQNEKLRERVSSLF